MINEKFDINFIEPNASQNFKIKMLTFDKYSEKLNPT